MSHRSPYPIGDAGKPWTAAHVHAWQQSQSVKRSYAEEVVQAIDALSADLFEKIEYGRLAVNPERYPLIALRSTHWNPAQPTALITGGVHGYESSGVHGALQFAREQAPRFTGDLNLIIAPCVSPWAYEMIQRWNPRAVDPNRSFHADTASPEADALMRFIAAQTESVRMHIDLHETTDSDESEFRPALAARDGKEFVPGVIPEGFYLVDDSVAPQPDFQAAIIDAVAAITPIAEADANGEIIGSPVVAPGVIRYPLKELALCAAMTDARWRTTTEVYPDSPRVDSRECNAAQVTAICAALSYVLQHSA